MKLINENKLVGCVLQAMEFEKNDDGICSCLGGSDEFNTYAIIELVPSGMYSETFLKQTEVQEKSDPAVYDEDFEL